MKSTSRPGFTSFRNYRIRALLYAGKPNWSLLAMIDHTPLKSEAPRNGGSTPSGLDDRAVPTVDDTIALPIAAEAALASFGDEAEGGSVVV